ncbi:CatB-related O-acetyltransferase [Methylobacterium sp. JK268]
MHVRLNQDSIRWLLDRRIFSTASLETNRFDVGATISFDEQTSVEPYCAFLEGGSLCEMGAFSYSWSYLEPSMKVGRYCSIAGGLLVPFPRHPLEKISTSSVFYDGQFSIAKQAIIDHNTNYDNFRQISKKEMPVIGSDVWIGAGATLMPGLAIGSGAVVAAKSVVVKDVPPYAIVGGNPAQIIKMRFSQNTINNLLEQQWWRYHFSEFKDLDLDNPDHFSKQLDRLIKAGLRPYEPDRIFLGEMPHDRI